MNVRTPQFSKHPTGQWFAKWGGKFHYFGTDQAAARNKYIASLQEWSAWKSQREARKAAPEMATLCIDLYESFLQYKGLELGDGTQAYYRKHLKRFLAIFGGFQADGFKPLDLHKLKEHMLHKKFAPKTINHDLTAVRVMFNWASGLEYVPAVNFSAVKNLPLGPPPDKTLPFEEVHKMVHDSPEHMGPWLAINYLCLMRPSEVVRVVGGQGEWVEPGVFRVQSKTGKITRQHRHVLFSDRALHWLERCAPQWKRLDSYSSAVCSACDHGPGVLRHTAASHLHKNHGTTREDVDLLLGHAPSRVSLTYNPVDWQSLRRSVARLHV